MGTVITLTLFRRTARASAWALLLVDLFVLVVWAASGGGSLWPMWVWLPTGLAVASARGGGAGASRSAGWGGGAAGEPLRETGGRGGSGLALPGRRLGSRGTRVVLAGVADRRHRA